MLGKNFKLRNFALKRIGIGTNITKNYSIWLRFGHLI